MAREEWRGCLARWVAASLIDEAAAAKIRAYEEGQVPPAGLRWPVIVALSLGGLMLAAGVLLLVAARWEDLSPTARLSVVLVMVAAFHIAGALVTGRFEALAVTLHTVGTAALGAGIFLAAQIFNLEEHWPGGFMLWAAGAWVAWWLRRDWPQAALAAVLTPIWLGGEWAVAGEGGQMNPRVLLAGLLLLALAYLTAATGERRGLVRRSLVWIGSLAILPCALSTAISGTMPYPTPAGRAAEAAGWLAAVVVPSAVACLLRRREALVNLAFVPWVVLLSLLSQWKWTLAVQGWCALGALGLIAWGARESRAERINLGFAGFALSVFSFYISSMTDKLGRSASLIGLGLLFLAGGWLLERSRRRLIARVGGDQG
jgi:uncharacterized membrane protein